MRVDLNGLFPGEVGGNGASKPVSRPPKQDADDAQGVTTSLSSDKSSIGALQGLVQQVPEVRTQLVADLKQSIQDGTYRADPRQTAAAMMQAVANWFGN